MWHFFLLLGAAGIGCLLLGLILAILYAEGERNHAETEYIEVEKE